MLHIMVLLKFLGSYGNEASLAKLGLMLGISKRGSERLRKTGMQCNFEAS